MRAKGLSKTEVMAKLKQARERDLKYERGRILCSMCTKPNAMAREAHTLFLDSNLGDPGLFPGTAQLEKEAVSALAELLHHKDGVGFIVTGGTEANLLGLLAARNMSDVERPEVILPESAHFSFKKICNILKLKPVTTALTEAFSVDPSVVEQCINDNTVAVVANAGSSEVGAVDPVNALSQIALEHGVHLHVDAAFGGLVLPFLKELGYAVPEFDFALEGVSSITVDPHKMGMSTIPSGGILFRDSAFLNAIGTETPYLTEKEQHTFVGTRSGASAAATWAVFESLGREGFRKIVKRCMTVTERLSLGLEEQGFEVLLRPVLNIVAFRGANTRRLALRLRERGWCVSYVPRLDCIRVVLMPHTTERHIVAFLSVLAELRG
ncbi:MAG: tyrosine decarboxylase MfnA [Candidatus Bathyarchaeia archaeon]